MARITFLFLFVAILIASCQQKVQSPLQIVEGITAVDTFSVLEGDSAFQETYELWFTQPIDHNDPEKGTFKQRAVYSHRGFDRPTVVIIEGYYMYSYMQSELAKLLDANQIVIEHRYFAKSRPADSIPWSTLNIRNAAADQHNIIQAFKPYYDRKWLSTGISKGGQTTIFHRSQYPDDVDVSVPYVAPLNFSNIDERVFHFLDTIGSDECRQKIYDFQVELLKRKKELLPMLKDLAEQRNWEFVMGIDSAYDLSVFEFSFALWQWVDNDCESIPPLDTTNEAIFEYWNRSTGFTFFEENSTEPTRPFFYQAMTEIGMYGYDADLFEGYTNMKGIIDFNWTMPQGYKHVKFNPEPMKKVHEWIQNEGNYMLYLYGGQDAWSATAVDPGNKTNAVILMNPGVNHRSRIRNYPEHLQDSIYTILKNWMEVETINK